MWNLILSLAVLIVVLTQVSGQFGGRAGFRIYNGMPSYGHVSVPKPKTGSCPPKLKTSLCKSNCKIDDECVLEEKCCVTACGSTICVPPMTKIDTRVKGGYCPKKPKGPWICNNLCTSDMDCEGVMKCCKNRCGALTCIKPDTYFAG